LQPGATSAQALQQVCHLTTQIDAPRLCLLVDQCEEVFTLCQDRAEREGFLALLQHVATTVGGSTLVIIAMRADFVGQATHYMALADMLSRGPGSPFLVTPMTDQELRRAITEPACVVGVSVEDVLVETIVQEVSREPGLLPLMAYALAQLWTTRRSDNVLTLRAYRFIGGVHGALTKRAEEVFTTFTPAQQQVARHILLRLTQPGEGTEATRRHATPAELVTQADDHDMVAQVVQLLADARLLVTREDGQIAMAHEALIRGWDRLQMWLDQDREFLLWQQRLRVAIADWKRTQDVDALWRGSLLAEAERQLAERTADLSPSERQFIEACRAQWEHEVHAKEAQRQRDLAAARQLAMEAEGRRRAQRRMMGVWAAGFLAALVISSIALKEWHRANIAQVKAEAHYLASQAALVLDTTGDGLIRSGLLATESLRRTPTLAGYQAWARVVTLLPEESAHFPHPGVQAVAFSPDGTQLLTGSEDQTARLWNVATGSEVWQLPHQGAVQVVAFSLDGTRLLTGSEDKTARVWNVATGEEVWQLPHQGAVQAVAFSPNGHYVVTKTWQTVQVWEAATGVEVARLRCETAALAFDPAGMPMALESDDKALRVWDVMTGVEIAHLPHVVGVRNAAWSPSTGRLAIGTWSDGVSVWDAAAGSEVVRLPHQQGVEVVQFSPDGRWLATGSGDGTVRVWEAATGMETGRLPLAHAVKAIVFSPNGRYIAVGSGDTSVGVWNVTKGIEEVRLSHDHWVQAVAFSPDGRSLATGSTDKTARVWDVITGMEQTRLAHAEGVTAVAFSPDGAQLATGSWDWTVRVWESATGAEQARLSHQAPVFAVAYSPDGRYVVTGSREQTVQVWETITWTAVAHLPHTFEVRAVAFSPSDIHLATGGTDGVRLWDTTMWREVARLSEAWRVEAVAFSPDGRMLAAGGLARRLESSGPAEGTVWVWNVTTGTIVVQLPHQTRVSAIGFSPDGKHLATGGQDELVRIWDTTTWTVVATLPHKGWVLAVAFSPEGKYLVTGDRSSAARLWNVQITDWIQAACARLPRNLTLQEWQRYFSDVPYRATCTNLPPRQ
jgi:WD40 repeat protein